MISVQVLAHNAEKSIKNCIESLKIQGNAEIVIVDDSIDNTGKIVEKYHVKHVKCLPCPIPEARNKGLNASRGDILAFTDDDCFAQKGWLKELEKSLKKYDVVGGPTLPAKTNAFGYCVSALGYPGRGSLGALIEHEQDVNYLSTCNLAMKRGVFEKVGFFDEKLSNGGEDTDYINRIKAAGFTLGFNPKARVLHKPRDNLIVFAKWWIRRGKADVPFYKKHVTRYPISLFFIRWSHLALFLGTFVAIIVLGFWAGVVILGALYLKSLEIKTWSKLKNKGVFPKSRIHFLTTIPFLKTIMFCSRIYGRISALLFSGNNKC